MEVHARDCAYHLVYQTLISSFTFVVESEQAEALPLAEDEANCGHPHLS